MKGNGTSGNGTSSSANGNGARSNGSSHSAIRGFFEGRVQEWDTDRYLDETYVSRARVALGFLRSAGDRKHVLDLGCGTGRQSLELLRAGDLVVSTDFSFEMARATRDRIEREVPGTRAAVVVSDALHSPFREGSFDAVVALGLVGFVQDRPALLRELNGILRPAGTLVCDAGVPERSVLFNMIGRTLSAPFAALRRLAARVLGRPLPPRPIGWYGQNFIKHAPAEFERLLSSGGFQPVARGGAGYGELFLGKWSVLPWRVQNWLARQLSKLSVRRGGRFFARHALTYVVKSVRRAAWHNEARPAWESVDAPAVRR